ncbi:MAG TPA: hypothetical protein VKQ28_05210 [Candidatus Acidoferrum sp.]|nr:hypothetical protein [Candidatus Acidoferrum sp.]
MISLRAKLELLAAVILLVAAVLGFRTWLSEHDLRMRAEAQAKAQEAVQSQAAAQIAVLGKQMADRDAAYQAQLRSLDSRFSQAQSPDQIAQLVSGLMGLKQPIQIVTPAATAANPNPQPVAQVPVMDAPQAKAYIQECEACKAERAKLQADAADRAKQADLAQKQIEALKGEVTTWKTAAKGGTVLQRLGRAAKWVAIGAGAGAAALCGSGHCK